jgi:hypothetical protein
MGPVSGVTFIYATHAGHNTLEDHGWRLDPQAGQGPTIDVFELSGGRSQTPGTPSHGARRRRFLR